MPSSQAQARILASFIINASLLILSASAQHHPNHDNGGGGHHLHPHKNHYHNLKVPAVNATTTAVHRPVTIPNNPNNGGIPPAYEFLIAHNKVRAELGQPLLQWNKTLARYARRWAAKRVADCKMIHSYGPYGENIFWGGKDHWTPTDAVREWVDEHKYYHRDSNECDPNEMCGHYTQVIWRDTLRVGCYRAKCNNGGLFIICSYDPPGNYVGENPFQNFNVPSPPSLGTPPQSGPLNSQTTTTPES